jgi:hypothetical protein
MRTDIILDQTGVESGISRLLFGNISTSFLGSKTIVLKSALPLELALNSTLLQLDNYRTDEA